MNRLMLAMLVGWLLLALTSPLALAQEKRQPSAAVEKLDPALQPRYEVTEWNNLRHGPALLALVLMALIIFQLLMVRSMLEKLVNKAGIKK